MDITRRRKIALILNILVIAFAVIGTVLMLFPYSENEEFLTHGFGNLKYFTVGGGFRMSVFSLDAGYVIATAKSNPLDQTLRFTMTFDMDGIKDLFRR